MTGDLDTHDSPCRFLAAHSGAAVLSTTYRLAPEHPFPAAVEDAQAAFRWAVESASELGADPARIAIGGDSAGGNLAAGVCIAMRDAGRSRAAMQLLIYPATDAIDVRRSRGLFAEGFILTKADIDHCERAYLPEKWATTRSPRSSVRRTSPACRRPTSPPPASTRCATRARPTRSGCAQPGSRSRCAATRG